MSDNGKGSAARPFAISKDEFYDKLEATFGRKKTWYELRDEQTQRIEESNVSREETRNDREGHQIHNPTGSE